jgi:hypothetical protein
MRPSFRPPVLSGLALAFSSTFASAQTTWFVDVNGTPPGTGTQLDPYTSIQYAISRPTTIDGDSVNVSPGTYFENIDFLGKTITVESATGAASTIIDANHVGSVVTFASNEGPASVLSAFTLRNGKGTNVASITRGGGVYCNLGAPSLLFLVIENNEARYGAGVYLENSSAQVVQCTIQNNQTPSDCCGPTTYGNGAYVSCGSSPTFDGCTISHNKLGSTHDGGGVFGGGTYQNCTIEDNLAFQGGGVAAPSGCSPQLVGCTIKNNRTGSDTSDANGGGGVYGPATLTNCTITGNKGTFFGGGAYNCTLIGCEIAGNKVDFAASTSTFGRGGGASACVLLDCNVHDNLATGANPMFVPSTGGGITSSTATRCRIWRNTADHGAGAYNSTLVNCTVHGNTAAVNGGGYSLTSGTMNTIKNSILWGNTPNAIDPSGLAPTVSYSDIAGGFAGTGNIALDPKLWEPLSGDFHLKPGSPCIDTGDPSMTDPDNSRIDMGAIPYVPNYCGMPGTYCTAKVNSHGCPPAISFMGSPTISGADNFFVNANQELNQRSGLMIWALTPAAQPALGGILCVHSFKRTPAQNSGGTALPTIDCSGTYSYFFSHAYMGAQGITAGTTIYAQYYGRDPFIPDGTGASLSNALEFTICP